MEVLSERVRFSDGRVCAVIMVNFHKLSSTVASRAGECEFEWREFLHASAGLCCVCLPDMEQSAVYSSLTGAGSKAVLVLENRQAVLQRRSANQRLKMESRNHRPVGTEERKSRVKCGERVEEGGGDGDRVEEGGCDGERVEEGGGDGERVEEGGCDDDRVEEGGGEGDRRDDEMDFSDLFSGSESEEETAEEEDEFASGRSGFLAGAAIRKKQPSHTLASVGAEHCLVGCAAFLRLSIKPQSSAVQLSLLAVRGGARGTGVGGQLLSCCKDPSSVGHYDALLSYVDHKAEGFFLHHGFVDDPIITAKYRSLVEPWENSTLMAYLPPYSGSVSGVGSLQSLTHFEDHFKQWRGQAIASYCEQLSFMERVRHEVLLLNGKVQSQADLITELSQQLQQSREERGRVEREFAVYRKHVQRQLCEAAVARAEQWLAVTEATPPA